MGAEGTANSSPNKLMKYHQTVQGDEIRNFYTSKDNQKQNGTISPYISGSVK